MGDRDLRGYLGPIPDVPLIVSVGRLVRRKPPGGWSAVAPRAPEAHIRAGWGDGPSLAGSTPWRRVSPSMHSCAASPSSPVVAAYLGGTTALGLP